MVSRYWLSPGANQSSDTCRPLSQIRKVPIAAA